MAASALGTSEQTVRSLLRKGELEGRKEPWGTRYVWVVSRVGVEEFVARHGRLDGRRRRMPRPDEDLADDTITLLEIAPAAEIVTDDQRPFPLRPRGRATVAVLVLGVPLLVLFVITRLLPDVLWFEELGQLDVYRRTLEARVQSYVAVLLLVAVVVGVNLAVALRRTSIVRRPTGVLSLTAAAVLTGTVLAGAADGHWQTVLLWRHRQPFGEVDPLHGKDLGFFVFSLPMELLVWRLLAWLLVLTTAYVVVVYLAEGQLRLRHAAFGAQVHLAVLAAAALLLAGWRFHLQGYLLELDQPSAGRGSFAGATYADVHARLPGYETLATYAVLLALVVVVAPFVARATTAHHGMLLVAVPGGLLVLGTVLVTTVIPALVQRYQVDPSPLLREQHYLDSSIAATRDGLGLDALDVETYAPDRAFRASDYPAIDDRLSHVAVWDTSMLEARMRELVSDTPYFAPQPPVLDDARVGGRRRLSVVSSRELDPTLAGETTGSWRSDRLAYTHGLGLLRFSGTDVGSDRGPRRLGSPLGTSQPRIYFGNYPDPVSWVVANTRRAEVDGPGTDVSPATAYHYGGTGGIELSGWLRRAAFAVDLGSKEMLLSDDITPESRLLLHRDVHDRLHTLAPFVQWDSQATPLTDAGRIVYVVDGYTTSTTYPYAERVGLGGTPVSYARASVRATVDAFDGHVELYLTDDADPIARAWAEAFPTLFRPGTELPAELRSRLRYPQDLFDTQAAAYETFHTTQPDVFVSGSDAWSRPLALAGPIEVAGNVDFDEDDEDDLRLTMAPAYSYSTPPGGSDPRILLSTYYVPHRGQNLVGTLTGWIDDDGRARLAARSLPRDPVTLGPAQVSRLVFATPRVSNLLGLRNLEVRDLDTSSLDAVVLGQPHLVFLPEGVIQVQSLFEGSRGAGAARLLGVTVYLNGRAGLGPTVASAVRQALNDPPTVDVAPPGGPVSVDRPVDVSFRVRNATHEIVTISTPSGSTTRRLRIADGQGTVTVRPSEPGPVRVRVRVEGLDGTVVTGHAAFQVLSSPPEVRIVRAPARVVAGAQVRVLFAVENGVRESAEIATRAGIELTRQYRVGNDTAVVKWTPQAPGPARLVVRVVGRQGQVDRAVLRFDVAPRPPTSPTPSITLLEVPDVATVGVPAEIVFRAGDCRTARARIEPLDDESAEDTVVDFPCPADRATFTWTPTDAGRYLLSVIARGGGLTVQASTRLHAEEP